MRTQLLCTFTNNRALSKTVDRIIDAYDILYNKMFVLKNENDTRELMCTYNIDTSFQVDWENYRNCIMVTNDDGLRRIDTSVKEIIHIKVKR